jgi:hypothetical protein
MHSSWAAPTAGLGGLLWVLYGPLAMLQPWGVDVVYRDSLGYSEIVSTPLFLAYSLPGALALVLTAAALLLMRPILERGRPWARAARGLSWAALVLGIASLAGVAARFDPVFTAGRIFGTLALGLAALAAGAAAAGAPDTRWRTVLWVLGALGVFLLPLWPLVHALAWLPPAAGALLIALFGAAWVTVGWRLARGDGSSRSPA